MTVENNPGYPFQHEKIITNDVFQNLVTGFIPVAYTARSSSSDLKLSCIVYLIKNLSKPGYPYQSSNRTRT